VLDCVGAGFFHDAVESFLAGMAIEACRAHLDQFVRVQRAVDLGDHFLGDALRADVNNRIELVGFRLSALRSAGVMNESTNLMSK
jgi:hypothetical protein